jgi:hypothetical protein
VGSASIARRVKRLALVVMLSCLALVAAVADPTDLRGDGRLAVAVLVAVIACWAIVTEVAAHVRAERRERAENARAARLEGARLTATAMQDLIANKLSLTVGYCEFLATDPRMPPDLREQAELALLGARAAAESMSKLKRMTKDSSGESPAFLQVCSSEDDPSELSEATR